MSGSGAGRRYLIETQINGFSMQRVWNSSEPLELGYPKVYRFELTEGGVEVTMFARAAAASPEAAGVPELIALAPFASVEQGCVIRMSKEVTSTKLRASPTATGAQPAAPAGLPAKSSVPSILIRPARNITPVFQRRALSDRTRFFDVRSMNTKTEEELFVFTCIGSWILMTEPIEVGFMRSQYMGYMYGKAVFKLARGKEKFTVKSTHVELAVSVGSASHAIPPGQSIDFPLADLNRTVIQAAPFTWKVSNVQPLNLLASDGVDQNPDAVFFRKIRNRAAISFLLLIGALQLMPPAAVVPKVPDQLTKLNFERPKILIQKQEPPKPKPTPTPEPPKPKPEPPKPKPEPPKPKPPKPKPKPEPPKPAPPKPMPAPAPPKPAPAKAVAPTPAAPPKVSPPAPAKAVAPAPAAPPKVSPPAPPKAVAPAPPPPAPPPPPKPQVDVSKALSFLGAAHKVTVAAVEPSQYKNTAERTAVKYDANSAALKSTATEHSLSHEVAPTAAESPISTRGAKAMKGEALAAGDVQVGKGVQAKVSIGQVYSGEGRGLASDQSGLAVSGGTISVEEIQKVLANKMTQFQYCYEKALLANPRLAGTVTMTWTIGASGSVSGTRVAQSQLNDASLHACLAGILNKLTFPAPRGGDAQVEYPFKFSATRF